MSPSEDEVREEQNYGEIKAMHTHTTTSSLSYKPHSVLTWRMASISPSWEFRPLFLPVQIRTSAEWTRKISQMESRKSFSSTHMLQHPAGSTNFLKCHDLKFKELSGCRCIHIEEWKLLFLLICIQSSCTKAGYSNGILGREQEAVKTLLTFKLSPWLSLVWLQSVVVG